jgi:phenylacetate-CoA ligase
LAQRSGVDWTALRVHVIAGEEPLAENARNYLEYLLGADVTRPEDGVIASSMGVAELGLNLFSEVPPLAPLIRLRRLFHENGDVRRHVFGTRLSVPSLFTYDPRRIYVEFDARERLIVTSLEPYLRLPLIRYATGDRGHFLNVPDEIRPNVESSGIAWELVQAIPVVAIAGRGDHASAGEIPIYPEEVKEGIYADFRLAALTTANFRLVSGPQSARIRIQLSPGVQRTNEMERDFLAAITRYVTAPITVDCELYESFGSGMALDYERKFNYLGR